MSKQYFGTDGIRGRVGDDLIHPDFCLKLGRSVGRALSVKGRRPLVILGKDTRNSGYRLGCRPQELMWRCWVLFLLPQLRT